MYSLTVRNINEALFSLKGVLISYGQKNESENGFVLELPFSIGMTILNPRERCLFWPKRRWNPFFVFHKAMWMLAGRKDIEWLHRYGEDNYHTPCGYRMINHDMESYSEEESMFNAPHGNQIRETINLLKTQPNTRQAVIQIWDYRFDGPFNKTLNDTYDMLVLFSLKNKKLRMAVVSSSNDLLLDFCNTSYVQFSVLQEYVAANVGARGSTCSYFSNCMFLHLETPEAELLKKFELGNRYEGSNFKITPLIRNRAIWDVELQAYMKDGGNLDYSEPWFANVMAPLDRAWWQHKERNYSKAIEYALNIASEDIREAAMSWLLETQKIWEE